MKMSKRQYRIGELAKSLNIEKFVIRFWEKELEIKPQRSKGGQRFYQEKDFQTFLAVKELLYQKKYTLAGAKKELSNMKKNRSIIPSLEMKEKPESCTCKKQLANLKAQLLKIKQAL